MKKNEIVLIPFKNFFKIKYREGDYYMNNKIMTKMNVKNNLVNVMRVNNIDYISLTDLARYKNPDNPGDVIIKWMSNKSSFDFYSLWEELFNEDFKLAESREFKNDSANNSFTISSNSFSLTHSSQTGKQISYLSVIFLILFSSFVLILI